MKFLNRIVLVLLFISLSVSLSAQEFLWSVGVDMMFDNREYGKSKYNWPQTIFGGYINPLVGIGWRGNSIQAGVSAMRNFGAPTKDMDVNFVFFIIIGIIVSMFRPVSYRVAKLSVGARRFSVIP